jgi:hypothetical protein
MKHRSNPQRRSTPADHAEHRPSPAVKDRIPANGQALDQSTRSFFENRFQYDFSRVRVHTDSEAAESAKSVNASAYTVGNDLVFGADQFHPSSPQGRLLVAHELAHVVQQSRGGSAPAPHPDSDLERSADHAALDVVAGKPSVTVNGASGRGLARSVAPSSLDRQLDPASMSEEQINREIELITRWLKDNPSSPQADRLASTLGRLKEELGHRPVKAGPGATGGAGGAAAGRGFAELRFPVRLVKQPAPPPSTALSSSPPASINTPPPATHKGGGIESLLPRSASPTGPGLLERSLLNPAPTGPNAQNKPPDKKLPDQAAAQPKPPQQKEDDDKPGVGFQTGTGEQTGLRAPHHAFQYVQVSAEFSNAYVASLDKDKLPDFLKGALKSISFVGEPGWTVQYHIVGDQQGAVDLQFLMKLMQVSLEHVDLSIVGGAGWADIGSKWDSSRFTPLAGIESETEILKKGPLSLTWVLDGLAALPRPQRPPDIMGRVQPQPGREIDGQFSGELRLKLFWDVGLGKPSEKKRGTQGAP